MLRALLTCVSAVALVAAAGCGSSSGGTDQANTANGPVELTVATFTEFGYEDLLKEYEQAHSNIKITQRKTGQGGPYHQEFLTKLAAGSGLADVQALEEGHLSDFLDKSAKFNDLNQIGPQGLQDRWLKWKYDAGKSKDGKLIGYGTDIGPLAMCYRTDMFAAAGLPTDPAGVKSLFATWDSYFAAGDQFTKATGKAWFDSSAQVFNAMINQLDTGYLNTDDTLAIESNPGIKKSWDQVTSAATHGQSAKLTAFSPEWNSGFKQGAFATKTCPSWMLGVVKEQAGPENAGKWAVTDAFPNGGGNWGGSYLTVPTQSKHPKEAAELAAWLTAPEQQLKAFKKTGNFPSQVKAMESPELLATTNDYFGATKIGELFAAQAKKVTKAQYKGPKDGQIQENVTSPALSAVEQGKSPSDGWQQVVDGAKKLVR
ncbi:extracellular solute-binding protein [Solihabitans fulvus]|uniref:Extracellular solute-binding protein n=1 Tax=Solihabitans fulvus TaxID=1892852 RepID=A0A5B2WNX6_9PSEU|nr:extracellular solute-binding protein [Solihabitans fulvus]KAA2252196.1 extracellular solute-binding protein [Solihabitans fulvus]